MPDLPDTAQTWPQPEVPGPEVPGPEHLGLFECLRQLVLTFAKPALPQDLVIQGWQNKAALPAAVQAGPNDLAVISLLDATQRGSSVERYLPELERLELRALFVSSAQVDFWSDCDKARQRALNLALACASGPGAEFMRLRGYGLLHCRNLGEHSRELDSGQYLRRWRVELLLGHNQGLDLPLPGTKQLEINQLYSFTRQP